MRRRMMLKGNAYIKARGGTITRNGDWLIHTFTINGNFVVEGLSSNIAYNLLKINVVGGGGSGGASGGAVGGGGGGAGQFYENLSYALSSGIGSYPCVVGLGGVGVSTPTGNNGNASSFDGVTALGGSYGSCYTVLAGNGYNAGGGSGYNSIGEIIGGTGTNKNGGNGTHSPYYTGGGGAGQSQDGQNATSLAAGNGGAGILSSINGSYYSGGGGGGTYSIYATKGIGGIGGGGNGGDDIGTPVAPTNGSANTGGGGGGGQTSNTPGGRGGSGIIIISYFSPL